MAKKSKTQKAKASAARQARKAEKKLQDDFTASESGAALKASSDESVKKPSEPKKSIFKKPQGESPSASDSSSKKKELSKDAKAPKKSRFQFFRDVRSELKRVTWPTRMDVLRWSGVVVCALIFFGIFTAVLDNLIVTPLLYLVSGVDPSSADVASAVDYANSAVVDTGADVTGEDALMDASGDDDIVIDNLDTNDADNASVSEESESGE